MSTPRELPRWPLTVMFVLFPLWWVLGPGEAVWILLAGVMLLLLNRHGRIRIPRGFGIWLLFLLWMVCSVIGIDTEGRMIGFIYRALLYLTVTVAFLYVYNARVTLTPRYVLGVLTIFWLVVVAGGYLGVLWPLFSINTPLLAVLPQWLTTNDLIQEMVVRRATQYNPNSWLQLDPRPSAPFLYTNGWGNAYSVLTPMVIAYLALVRRERRFWWLLPVVPLSFVPAFLTLNRGMFIGLGVALAYILIRSVLQGNVRAILTVVGIAVLASVALVTLPIAERLTERVESSSSTEDRASLYIEAFERTLEQPVFGYGSPRPSETTGAPSVGTQGQFWMVMFSHGFPGAALFMGWLAWAYFRSVRERDPVGLACNTVLLLTLVESLYYGIMTAGLMVAMLAAAVALRPEEDAEPTGRLPEALSQEK
ncbi:MULTISPECIES: O-antigen ligase [unclassified Cryobacterium]|uniref:O-antigen ligase family protein n=1 Tax=unclassified Cryobacterium TaxID=2649013 RepID=UPI00130492EF|nr:MULTISPECIES: O-antigen ligase family protein [unclassified Cryobacterium]